MQFAMSEKSDLLEGYRLYFSFHHNVYSDIIACWFILIYLYNTTLLIHKCDSRSEDVIM